MKHCPNCGVELDEKMQKCPLCYGEPSGLNYKTTEPEHEPHSLINEDNNNRPFNRELSLRQKRKVFWELSTLILLLGIVVTLIVDFITSHTISWSKITVLSSLVLFCNISLVNFIPHRRLILGCGSYVSFWLFLLLLDKLITNAGWGIKLGIPLLTLIYFFILVFSLISYFTKEKGLNLIGYFFLLCGLFIPAIEMLIDKFFLGNIKLGWSIYVIASVLPMCIVLLFVHYRMKKGRDLKRLFHI